VRTLSYVGENNISKMAACNRKWISNNEYLGNEIPIYGYIYVFDVKHHDWIDLNTAVCRGEWEIKDGGL